MLLKYYPSPVKNYQFVMFLSEISRPYSTLPHSFLSQLHLPWRDILGAFRCQMHYRTPFCFHNIIYTHAQNQNHARAPHIFIAIAPRSRSYGTPRVTKLIRRGNVLLPQVDNETMTQKKSQPLFILPRGKSIPRGTNFYPYPDVRDHITQGHAHYRVLQGLGQRSSHLLEQYMQCCCSE